MTALFPRITLLLAALVMAATVGAAPADFDAELQAIQTEWARANYAVPAAERPAAFDALMARSAAFAERNPKRAEALIWDGIVLSTAAGVRGGLGALSLAKKSRARLEAALAIDPDALQGSAHTSLGTLYHKVPGFPIGFGSDKKARTHLEKALELNPAGIDPNYFYAEFLYDNGDRAGALRHLEKAKKAPPRPDRRTADEGRQRDIEQLMGKVRASGS